MDIPARPLSKEEAAYLDAVKENLEAFTGYKPEQRAELLKAQEDMLRRDNPSDDALKAWTADKKKETAAKKAETAAAAPAPAPSAPTPPKPAAAPALAAPTADEAAIYKKEAVKLAATIGITDEKQKEAFAQAQLEKAQKNAKDGKSWGSQIDRQAAAIASAEKLRDQYQMEAFDKKIPEAQRAEYVKNQFKQNAAFKDDIAAAANAAAPATSAAKTPNAAERNMGGLFGGGLGALLGAMLGPIGALIGGLLGFITGNRMQAQTEQTQAAQKHNDGMKNNTNALAAALMQDNPDKGKEIASALRKFEGLTANKDEQDHIKRAAITFAGMSNKEIDEKLSQPLLNDKGKPVGKDGKPLKEGQEALTIGEALKDNKYKYAAEKQLVDEAAKTYGAKMDNAKKAAGALKEAGGIFAIAGGAIDAAVAAAPPPLPGKGPVVAAGAGK